MTITYCAHFWLNGEDRIVKADSAESLRLAIFGRAYAPAHDSVMYWTEQTLPYGILKVIA